LAAHIAKEHTPVKFDPQWFFEHVEIMPWAPAVKRDLLVNLGFTRTEVERYLKMLDQEVPP
jgi:hypothetical protein